MPIGMEEKIMLISLNLNSDKVKKHAYHIKGDRYVFFERII